MNEDFVTAKAMVTKFSSSLNMLSEFRCFLIVRLFWMCLTALESLALLTNTTFDVRARQGRVRPGTKLDGRENDYHWFS